MSSYIHINRNTTHWKVLANTKDFIQQKGKKRRRYQINQGMGKRYQVNQGSEGCPERKKNSILKN